jgi:hypothetical protein
MWNRVGQKPILVVAVVTVVALFILGLLLAPTSRLVETVNENIFGENLARLKHVVKTSTNSRSVFLTPSSTTGGVGHRTGALFLASCVAYRLNATLLLDPILWTEKRGKVVCLFLPY